MYVWLGIYKHKGKTYYGYGLAKYLTIEEAAEEAKLLADKGYYKYLIGVPRAARLVQLEVVSWVQ